MEMTDIFTGKDFVSWLGMEPSRKSEMLAEAIDISLKSPFVLSNMRDRLYQ